MFRGMAAPCAAFCPLPTLFCFCLLSAFQPIQISSSACFHSLTLISCACVTLKRRQLGYKNKYFIVGKCSSTINNITCYTFIMTFYCMTSFCSIGHCFYQEGQHLLTMVTAETWEHDMATTKSNQEIRQVVKKIQSDSE